MGWSDITYISEYNAFLQIDLGRQYMPQFLHELAKAQQHSEHTTADSDEEIEQSDDEHNNKWTLLCYLNCHFTTQSQLHTYTVDWNAYASSLPPHVYS